MLDTLGLVDVISGGMTLSASAINDGAYSRRAADAGHERSGR